MFDITAATILCSAKFPLVPILPHQVHYGYEACNENDDNVSIASYIELKFLHESFELIAASIRRHSH